MSILILMIVVMFGAMLVPLRFADAPQPPTGEEPDGAKPDEDVAADEDEDETPSAPLPTAEEIKKAAGGDNGRADGQADDGIADEEARARVLDVAAAYGIPPEEIDPSKPDEFIRRLLDVDRSFATFSRGGGQAADNTPPAGGNYIPPVAEGGPKADENKALSKRERYALKIKKEEYEDGLVSELESMSKHIDDQLDLLDKKMSGLESAETARRQADHNRVVLATANDFDRAVVALGPEYAAFLGKGSTLAMNPNTPEARMRNEVAVTASDMFQSMLRMNGGQVPPGVTMDVLVRRAVNAVASEKVLEIERRKIAGSASKRSGQVVSRPTNRKAPVQSDPVKRARAAVEEKLAQLGPPGDDDDV